MESSPKLKIYRGRAGYDSMKSAQKGVLALRPCITVVISNFNII